MIIGRFAEAIGFEGTYNEGRARCNRGCRIPGAASTPAYIKRKRQCIAQCAATHPDKLGAFSPSTQSVDPQTMSAQQLWSLLKRGSEGWMSVVKRQEERRRRQTPR